MSKPRLWVKRFVFLLSLSAVFSCSQSNRGLDDPKQRLTTYISKSFSITQASEKQQLLAFLTGDVKARFEGWSEDQFREAFIDSKRQFIKLSFREVKQISPTEVEITYEIVYGDPGKGKDGKLHEAKVTNKKLCRMILEQGKWMITEVRNIKELVEYKNELTLP